MQILCNYSMYQLFKVTQTLNIYRMSADSTALDLKMVSFTFSLEWPLLGSELKKAGQANYSQAQVIVNTQQGMLHTHTDRQTHTTTVIISSKKASPI